MYWFLGGIVFIFILAFIIIKLSINTNENPDSSLGILEHPSAYKKQGIEMVDGDFKEVKNKDLFK